MVKKDIDTNALKVTDIYRSGPRTKIKNPDWDFLVYELKKLKVSPGEAFRIVSAYKDKETNIRFEWKMLRFTFLYGKESKKIKTYF